MKHGLLSPFIHHFSTNGFPLPNLLRLTALLVLATTFAACSDNEPDNNPDTPSQSITIPASEDTTPVLEQAGGTATLTFTATADWTAEVTAVTRTADWVSVQPTSGRAGENTLTITTQPNDTYDERNAAIILTCAGQQTTVTVTQKQQDALLVSSNKVELDAEGGSFSLTVQANVTVSHTIEEGASWLTTTSTRALTESTLTFEAAANEDTEPRQAVITLTGSGLTEQVTVYQAGTGPTLVLGQREYLVGSAGETIQVELRSNTDYEIQMPAVDWLTEASTRALSAYTHYFTIAPNDTYDSRTAPIIFTSKTEGIADTLTVTQLQLDAIVLAQSEYTVLAAEDTLSFPILANVEVTATTDADWITQLPTTRALQKQELRFRIDALPDTTDRQGTITLTGGGATQQITVKQIYQEPKLVRVEYRTGYTWEEAHDNLPLLYYATVYRDRYYENGEKFTDRFTDVGHPMELNAFCNLPNATDFALIDEDEWEKEFIDTGETINFHRPFINGNYFHEGDATSFLSDSILISNNAVEVDYPNRIRIEDRWITDKEDTGNVPGDWDAYIVSKLYTDEEYLYISPDEYPSEHERTDLQSGWYFQGFVGTMDQAYMHYNEQEHNLLNDMSVIYLVRLWLRCYDQFLVIDGRRIDFLEYLPEREYNTIVEDLPDTDEYMGGKRYTRELRAKFMGRNFYMSTTMDFYAAKDKYAPNEIYYFAGSDSDREYTWSTNTDDNNWWFHKGSNDLSTETFTIKASQEPILSTNAEWISINSVAQGNQVEGPIQLDVFDWNISCSPSSYYYDNAPSASRTGYIYLKNKKGETLRSAMISQLAVSDYDLFGTIDFEGSNESGGWGPWEIVQDWRNNGTLTYHMADNAAGITPTLTGVDTSEWPGLSWQQQGNDIVFHITLNTDIQQPRRAVIHLSFDGHEGIPPIDLILSQDGCPNEDLLDDYL